MFRKFIFTIAFLVGLCAHVSAQDTPDKIKLSVSFANSDYSLNDIQGVQGEIDARILRANRFRIGGVIHYVRPCFNCVSPQFDTYSLGPQLSYDVFGSRVSLFGRALFGLTTNYNGGNAFTRTYGGGCDVNLGNFFVRPIVLDVIRTEGLPVTVNRFGAGAGLRF